MPKVIVTTFFFPNIFNVPYFLQGYWPTGQFAFANASGVPSGGITEPVQMQSFCYQELPMRCSNVRHLLVSRHSSKPLEK
jgi:hypothetical protein